MKKYSIIGVVGSMLMIVILVTFMMQEKQKVDTSLKHATFVYEWSEQDIENKLLFSKDWLTHYEVYSSLAKAEYETIMILDVHEEKLKKVKAKIETYVEKLKETHPDQSNMITSHTKIYQQEQRLVLVVSENVKKIVKQIKAR